MEKGKKFLNVRDKDSKFKQYLGRGITSLIIVIFSIAFYFFLLRFEGFSNITSKIVVILRPIIYGVVIAYLLNPIVVFIERFLTKVLSKKIKNEKKVKRIGRIVGVFAAVVIGIAAIVALGFLVLPELFRSIRRVVYVLPRQMDAFIDWVSSLQRMDGDVGAIIQGILETGTEYFQDWLRNDLLTQVNTMMSSLTQGVLSFLKTLLNLLIGIVVSIYILFSKETFAGQCKKICYAILGPEKGNFTIHIVRKSHQIFGGFILGKILDSFIIGVICFVGLSVLGMPYIVLVSVIIGVTNVIPFFGPYIGAVPSAILIALINPMQGVYFVIFIIILQQIDGNIIGPKILGDSTGVSPFWIVFSILLGGGLFGFVGMVVGVPTFAVFYYIVSLFINRRLEERKLPTATDRYKDLDHVDADSYEMKYGLLEGTEQKETKEEQE